MSWSVLWVAIKVIDGSLTIGDVVAFMTYVRIFSQPLSQIAQGITQLQSATAAIGRIFEFLEEKRYGRRVS